MNLINIYYKFPISFQNFALNLYGHKLKLFRYNKKFNKIVFDIRERNKLTIEEMIEIQETLIKQLIKHVYKNVPYYRKIMNKQNINPGMINSIEDLMVFPILTKSEIRENIDLFKAENIKRTIDNPTGGTTGSPLTMKTTHNESRYNFAIYEVREKEEFGMHTGLKTATFLGKHIVNPKAKEPPFWRHSKSLNQTMYSVYHMNNETLKYYVKNLKKDTPVYLTGYVTPIFQLANYIITNEVEPIRIKVVFLSSETLHLWQKEIIEEAFLCQVCNGYSQAEGVAFISSCKNGQLHVNPDYGVVEFLKVKDSDYYEIVGTTLFNYSMPLIRYRTGDYVILNDSDSCECGKPTYPLIKEIIGRDDSLLKSQSGKIISSAAISLIFKFFPEIYECQIIQESISNISVLLNLKIPINERLETEFKAKLINVIGNEFDIDIIEVNEINKTSSGKSKLIISNL